MISRTAAPPESLPYPVVTLRRRSLADFIDSDAIETVVVGSSKDPNPKLTILLIPEGNGQPRFALKVPTTDGAAAAVEDEMRVLLALRGRCAEPVRSTIPRVVGQVDMGGRWGLLMNALPGVTMTSRYHGWRHTARPDAVVADFALAAAWLAGLHRATAGPVTALDMDQGIGVLLAHRYGAVAGMNHAVRELDAIYARLREHRTPRTAVHGDFWCGNLLIADGAVSGVVDWEAGSVLGEPARDLVRFAVTYAFYLDRHTRPGRGVAGHRGLRAGSFGGGLVYAMEGTGWFPELFRQFLQDELARLGASPGCWRDAVLAGIAEVAATADHPGFAGGHLQLFRRLAGLGPSDEWRS
jgi:aminoglycoside phosphotransferase